jgi:hypothetical protein
MEELEELVRGIENIDEILDAADRGKYLLGLGFLYYYASLAAGKRKRTEDANRYACASFRAGWQATELLAPMSLSWAFAVNHCAYTGTVTGVLPDETEQACHLLRQTRSTMNWHYRFADTLAYREYSLALEMWVSGRRGRTDRNLICARLREAERLLASTAPTYGDSEIDQHLLELRDLQLRAECQHNEPSKA